MFYLAQNNGLVQNVTRRLKCVDTNSKLLKNV